MNNKSRRIKIFIVVTTVLLLGVALWSISSIIIKKSYSSKDIVVEQNSNKVKDIESEEIESSESTEESFQYDENRYKKNLSNEELLNYTGGIDVGEEESD